MTVDKAVDYVWNRLTVFGYRPELIGARWSLRIVPCKVANKAAYQVAWDARGNAVLRGRA